MFALLLVPVFYISSVKAELYDHEGKKVGNVMLPIFQYSASDNMKECISQAEQLGPTYYCK